MEGTQAPLGAIMDRAICLVIEFGGFGLKRSASKATVQANADDEMWGVSKKLLVSDEHAAIVTLDRRVKVYLTTIGLPSPLKAGSHLIPIPLVEGVEQKLQSWRREREQLVEAFLAVYAEQVRLVRAKLRDLYRAEDYPSCEALRERYRLTWQYVDYGTPGRLKAISAQIFEAEREKQAATLREAADEIKQALRASFADLVGKMAAALGPAADGKRRVLQQRVIDNLASFMQIFEMRNIADDRELAALVTQARALIAGADTAILKSDVDLRKSIGDGFTEMAAQLKTLVVEKGTRAIQLDDDAEVA